MIGLTRILFVLTFAVNGLSSDVLASGKGFFKREADVFISRVRRGFAAEDADLLARSLWAFTNFVNEVIRWSDPESGFRIYALAHAIREVPEVSDMDEFFARFAFGIFAQVDVNLMSQEGIIREDRRVDVVNLFGQASKFGLDLTDVVTLLQLPETQLKDGLTVLSGADGIEANRREAVVSWHLRQSHRIFQQNPSAGRLFELLRRNLAVPANIRMVIFFDPDLGEQIRLFLSLEPVSAGLWIDARVTRMMNSLGDLFELLPYISDREHTILLFNAFQTLLSALGRNIMVPWFDEILLKLETWVRQLNVSLKIFEEIHRFVPPLRNEEINRNKLFQLRDRVVNTGESYSFESRISIIPKLVLYIDRASMLFKRICSDLPNQTDIVALVRAFVDTSLSILADSTSNNRNLLVGLAEVIRAGTAFIDTHRLDYHLLYPIFSSYAMALQITFEFYHRFGVFHPVFFNTLMRRPFERFRWPSQRINSIRIIMKSFLIFGKAEWNKLLVWNQGERQHFAELFTLASQAHVDKAARFLARQALWRMKMYRENAEAQHEDDAPLFSPAEWLKLYIGGWSRYALWELNFSRSMTARDPVAVFNEGAVLPELRHLISSDLPFDRNTPTELSALAHEISALNDEIRYSPRISLLRSISNSLLRLPRLILQAEAELDILRGDKNLRRREILIKSARSLTATLREAAISEENPHIIANINHIDEFTKQVVRILEDLTSPWSVIQYLFLKSKFDKLESLTHRIDRLQTDILNGQLTEGL